MPRAGDRLTPDQLASNFADLPRPMRSDEALFEATRCLYCYDAPCTRACPTQIDVPTFIRQILHRDPVGAARTILDANIFGGSCARACPTEVLCEGACVDNTLLKSPVQIGRLQRFACDAASSQGVRFFKPGASTGRRVAIVGSGPAGLSCAHELRRLGHEVVVFEARSLPGGLDSTGIAAYKVSTEFALAEIAEILEIGIDVQLDHPVSAPEIAGFLRDYDAVFLGIGLGRTASLKIEGEDSTGVWEALDFIAQTHVKKLEDCDVGRRVLVIGAGNTAIDVATASHRLGAESVTIAYRRGEPSIPAFPYEYGLAKADGVCFEWFANPVRIVVEAGRAVAVEFERVDLETRPRFRIEADMIVKALGQTPLFELIEALPGLEHREGRLLVNFETGETSIPGLFAGGDCTRKGGEVVDAVRDGKAAARGIENRLKKID